MTQELTQTTPAGALAPLSTRLLPASPELIAKGLGTVLALVAPSGFTEADRVLWLNVATRTLDGIPDDLLRRGIVHARKTVDHPAKVVKAIFDEIGPAWEARKREARRLVPVPRSLPSPPPCFEPDIPFAVDVIRSLTPPLRRMALEKGWLTEEEIEAAIEPPPPAKKRRSK